ncbi:peptide chain release factor N(5)-glutamine methyltransferase [Bacteroidetes bacterium endosymbiont of Geopemphigus sp.]|uniref:peptide chain release factor N(5)-glutamine methyltransferase n=1 Tax=Bacteroidetes bacterium endosymbiont of Geopemphigus sp. TaxID=2047937 RepID=UPI000CD28698|nr:peptide chain release factor N(5)-glutamine methyltransferase [Bacteroidetes bacterium endosymbiont of Geopemphigus sp.]
MDEHVELTQWKTRFQEELQKVYSQAREREEIFFLTATHVLQLSKTELRMALFEKRALRSAQSRSFEYLLSELKNYKPIQYLLGETFFYNIHLKLDENVLIPRAETEELVHWILLEISSISRPRILDIGTGSGCIALSLKKQLPQSEIYAIDSSCGSIKCAQKNAHLHDLHVHFIQTDILKKFPENLPLFDVIVSNPPYVRPSEKDLMSKSVLKYEPETALFVTEEHPLIFYQKISTWSLSKLARQGALYFEINQYLSEEILDLLKKSGYKNPQLKNDMQDAARMVKAISPNF